jgi:streptogramin lyase
MGIWLDGQGRVYVAVMGAGMVKRYDPATGRIEVVDRSPEPATPTGGLVAPNGDLWLLENAAGNAVRVRRIAVDGREQIF